MEIIEKHKTVERRGSALFLLLCFSRVTTCGAHTSSLL